MGRFVMEFAVFWIGLAGLAAVLLPSHHEFLKCPPTLIDRLVSHPIELALVAICWGGLVLFSFMRRRRPAK